MSFHFCVRSIGERTEELCATAIRAAFPDSSIKFIRGLTPSYKAYRAMFEWATTLQSADPAGWLVAIDADTVMLPGWGAAVTQRSGELSPSTTFKFFFQVFDPIFGVARSRGHHVYQLTWASEALRALEENVALIQGGKRPPDFHRDFTLKPESSLRIRMWRRRGLQTVVFPEIIGIHGAEQYLAEVVRTFMIRRQREPGLERRHPFLLPERRSMLTAEREYDRLAANVGWEAGASQVEISIDRGDEARILSLLQEARLSERDALSESYESFSHRYEFARTAPSDVIPQSGRVIPSES